MKGGRIREVEKGEKARAQELMKGKERRERGITGEQRSNRNKRKQNNDGHAILSSC